MPALVDMTTIPASGIFVQPVHLPPCRRVCHTAADGNTVKPEDAPLIVFLAAELQQHMLLLHACLTDAGCKFCQPIATGHLYLWPSLPFITC